jgi:hypothetical protein
MRYSLRVSSIVLTWPHSCACCGGAPETHLRASVSRTRQNEARMTTSWWEVPYCLRCARHIAKDRSARRFGAGAGAGTAVLMLMVIVSQADLITAAWLSGAAVATCLLGLALRQKLRTDARKLMVPACAAPGLAVEYRGWDGTAHELVFTSKPYLEAFTAANQPKTLPVRIVERFEEGEMHAHR